MDDGACREKVSGEGLRALNRRSEIVAGHWESQVLVTAYQLRLFDALAEAPAEVEDLVQRMGLRAGPLEQLLRALEGMGLVERSAGGICSGSEGGKHRSCAGIAYRVSSEQASIGNVE